MTQPQKLEAIVTQLRSGEVRMKEGDHIGFATLCLLIYLFTLLPLIEGQIWTFAFLNGCLGTAILLYYWIGTLRERRTWYWEKAWREVKGKGFSEMWNTSERGDWLFWFASHMIGKEGWPTLQQVVLASCQCARLALKHVKPGETRPLKAIETAEAWARGEATLEQVRDAGGGADYMEHETVPYLAAQSAKSACWVVYAIEDGACFRFGQAASDAAERAASADGYEVFENQLKAGNFGPSADAERDQVKRATLKECAEIARQMLSVPNALSNELPMYHWVKRWHRNSGGQRTGTMDHIPIAVSRTSPDVESNGSGTTESPNSVLRIVSVLMALTTAWALLEALNTKPIQYYVTLRWLTCATAVMLVWRGDIQKSLKWAYLLVPVAILFNPIIPIHLHGRHLDTLKNWHSIDVAVAALVLLTITLMEVQVWLMRRQ